MGAVCHGPAALLPITLSNGKPLIEDKTVTSFTREEEVDFGTIQDIPFLLEEALTRKAAKFSKIQHGVCMSLSMASSLPDRIRQVHTVW